MKAVRSQVRRACLLAVVVSLVAGSRAADGQTISATSYPLTTTSGLALEDMQSGTTQLLGPNLDDNASAVVPIGFDFWFVGTRYTQFSVNANGLLRLGGTAVAGSFSNDLANASNVPQITPYWDDLFIGTNGKVHFRVVGAAPNRKLVVEWQNLQVPRVGAGNAGAATFQCWLYETSGKIEFVYGAGMAANGINGGASIGFGSSATTFASVTSTSASVAYGTSNNANVSTIAAGTRYGFASPRPAAPINLTFSGVSATAATLHWTDSSMNEVGYAVYRSTDGINDVLVAQLPANSTALAQTGLTPLTTYFWTVVAFTEGALSNPLTASQETLAPGTITTTGSGNWSSTTPDAPWPGGILPTSSDQVVIADGDSIVVDTNASCYALTVGEGTSGRLGFDPTIARTLTIGGDVLVRPGGAIQTAPSGAQTGHVLSVGGNVTNDGTLDLSTAGNQAGARLTFTGESNTTFAGTGTTTNLRTMTINKGVAPDAVLTLAPAQFSVQGRSSGAGPFLTLTNGTLRIAGTFSMSDSVFASAAYQIAASAGLWLDNPNFSVLPQAGSPTVVGQLRVTQGNYGVGLGVDQSLGLASGSAFRLEGGTVNVAGRFAVTSGTAVASYTQSGGTLTAATAGNASTTLATFDLGTAAASSATISGGAIVLQTAGTSGVGPRDFRNRVGIQNITGGTLQIGNASSGAAQTFILSGTAPGVLLTNTSGNHALQLFAATTAVGTTTLQSGTSLNLNGFRWTQSEGNLINQGVLTGSTTGAELYFLGTATPQTYSGSGLITAPLRGSGLTVDNPAGLTIDSGVPQSVATVRVNLVRGTLHNSQLITLGDVGAVATTQVGASGLASAGGAYDTYPVVHPSATGSAVLYLQEGASRVTGFEIPASRTLASLTLNNANGVTLAGGNLSVTGSATLTAGILTTSNANVLGFANSVTTPPAGSAASYVEGPLAITFAVSSATTRTFAIGVAGSHRPLVLKSVNTGGVSRVFTAHVFAGATNGTPLSPLQALASSHYWVIENSAQLNAAARVNLTFGPDDNVGTLSNARVAQSSTVGGSYSNLGGTTTGTSSAGTVESSVNLTPGADDFAIGSVGSLATAWDGGAGTDNWGDAANWSPDGVPTSATSVSLTLPVLRTIVVNGTFSVAALTVGNNVNLALGSGTLNVVGAYNQSAGTVDLGSGTVTVGGTTTLSGGALAIQAGAFTSTGAVALSGGTTTFAAGGRLVAASTWTLSGGSLMLGAGTLDVAGAFSRTAGTFDSGTGTTILSGTALQTVSGSLTFYDLVFRNGGATKPKRLTGASNYTVNHDLTIESTAQTAVSTSDPTDLYLFGDLNYSGIAGGTNVGALKIHLKGSAKAIAGAGSSAILAPPGSSLSTSAREDAIEPESTVELNFLTDPVKALRTGTSRGGKPLLVLENTRAKRSQDVERALASAGPNARMIINLDDATLTRNPRSSADRGAPGTAFAAGSGEAVQSGSPAEFPMPVIVETGASYSLSGAASIASGQVLTVLGRLDCGTFTIGGAGGVAAFAPGTIATAVNSPSGLAATLITTGTNTYGDGAVIEYNAAGNQVINATNHPAAALIRTAGSGTKTLNGNKTLTGSSESGLGSGALFVGAGTTFADGGNRISFTTSQFANVIVNGTYLSTGTGALSYEAGPFESAIYAPDGTTFGDLLLNFASSAYSIGLNTTGSSELTFRNLVLGGVAGAGTAGGTLRLSQSGTTNLTVTGKVSIAPAVPTNSGGGFAGSIGRPSRVTLRGNLVSTSTAPTLPLFDGVAGDRLVWGGSTPESLAVQGDATVLAAGSFELANPAGLVLAGSGRSYRLGAGSAVDLAGARLFTGTNTLSLGAGCTLTRTSGRVVGRLEKSIPAGPASVVFEIGTDTLDTPVDLAFGSVSTPGPVAASTAPGDHANLSNSGLDSTRTLNRTFTLTNGGAVFDSCAITFHYSPTELDGAADPAAFLVRRFVTPTWFTTRAGTRTGTSTQATGVTGLGDFAIGQGRQFAIVANAGPHGAITPSSTTLVVSGDGLGFVATPDAGYHVADLLVDGVSQGALTSYVFSDVQSDHAIEVTFAINLYSINATAGLHGSIAPAGSVSVAHGSDQAFAITADANYNVADVQVDSVSQGAIANYTFTNVTAPHTIAATFEASAVVGASAPAGTISLVDSCVTIPITIQRVDATPVLGFSVSFALSPELALCSGDSGISEGTFLSGSGSTSFHVLDNGDGSYTVDGVVLGSGCGPTALSGTLFTVPVRGAVLEGSGTITITDVKLRDCVNAPLFAVAGTPIAVPIDRIAPAVSLLLPNGGEHWTVGTTHAITWSAADDAGVPAVDLAYSTDSGVSYPNVIASSLANSGTFDWQVPNTPGTAVRVRATAHDANGNPAADASDSDFEIREVNVAPVIAAIDDRNVDEGQELSFTVAAADSNQPPQSLMFSLVDPRPSGTQIDSLTGVFTWTPTEAQGPGDDSVTVRVVDNGEPPLAAQRSFVVHVAEVNLPPVLSGVPASATIPENVAYGFVATGSDPDLPAQWLRFSLSGAPSGASIDSGGTFSWTPTEDQGPGVYAFAVRLSDGIDSTEAAITLTVTEVAVSAITDLTATPVKTGNDADGTTRIHLAWTETASGTSVEVYRAPFGGYPRYDDDGGAVPPVPSYPPGPPWVLTAVNAPGTTDEPATRDFYYYVAFVRGIGENVSVASNRTLGTLNYALGDFSNAVTPGTGDNAVNTADLSLLGAHYGLYGAAVAPFGYLDVGPTTNYSVDARPTTDQAIDFEDLVLLALNYGAAHAPESAARTPGSTPDGDIDALSVEASHEVTAGATVPATISFRGSGLVQGISVELAWDPAVVRPVAASAGALTEQSDGLLLSPGPGAFDMALLGARAQGLSGEGVIATVTFEAISAGDPRIRIATVRARDAGNRDVEVSYLLPVAVPVVTRTALAPAVPNPFRDMTAIAFGLATRGPVEVAVYSVDGRRVRTLLRESREAGEYRLVWDGRNDQGSAVSPGVYFVRMAADHRVYRESMVYLR